MSQTLVENFYGCYLLVSQNPKYKKWTYIGFTVDPNRRIKQHNKGMKAGGAKKTQNKGPWSMVLIIHGFPNEISALRFEWAWQHPDKSSRLHHVTKKTRTETRFQFCLRILSEMLRTGPWNRLPLTIRWLKPEYQIDFQVQSSPPIHMPIVQGPVSCKKCTQINQSQTDVKSCDVCKLTIQNSSDQLTCFVPDCEMTAHVICLAKTVSLQFIIPIDVSCPKCKTTLLWGDLIRHKNGCYQYLKS